jgi:hypothetical protein
MKNLFFAFALLCSTSLVAQFSFNANGTGIQTPNATASGVQSTAMGLVTTASGENSTAMGYNTQASGRFSTAMGAVTEASGWYSTAMGGSTVASGDFSTAMGASTTASGGYSTAMGQGTSAQDYGTIAIGIFNKTKEASNPNQYSLQNTAFVIGNGVNNDNRSNAFEVLFDGSTTIAGNVTAPAFIGDGSQLTNLPTPTVNYSDITNVPLSYNENGTGIQSSNSIASGYYSRAMGNATAASGDYSTAMGNGTTANGDYSTAMGNLTFANGIVSTAMGDNTVAIGNGSTAMGFVTTASGTTATAMGGSTVASGDFSTAMGASTTASGGYSTAMGQGTSAQDYGTIAIGIFNKTKEASNPNQYSLQNTAFVIGNGTDSNNRSNAFEVLFDGSTTIAGNVTAPAFIGDGSQLTNLPTPTVNYSDITNVPLSYNENGTGIQSSNSIASGDYSRAMGNGTAASGNWSTAMGTQTQASGDYSTAMGTETVANGNWSTAIGYGTTASGNAATAMGNNNFASGVASTAMGASTTASGNVSTAMGSGTKASGIISTAMGLLTTAEDYSSFTIGSHNKADETPNPENFSYQNTAFVIGNGGFDSNGNYDGHLSNAFEVLFDGTTTIAGDLNINSDARLKANIISLGATLSKLLQIDGKTYTMKKDANHKKKIGLLAQDIEKVFPELVTETNDIKSVNYQGLVPVLINAMKEQDDKITKQQQEIDELKTMVKQLMSK